MDTASLSSKLKEYISKSLNIDWDEIIGSDKIKAAAVLIPLEVDENGEIKVLLTKRSQKVRSHPGDVCFPGGKFDSQVDKTFLDTALREAEEEINLLPANVTVVGEFLPIFSKHKQFVHSYVCTIPKDFNPILNEDEVASSFYLPLSRFLENEGHSIFKYETFIKGRFAYTHIFSDNVQEGHFVTYGLTAKLLIYLAMVIFDKIPEFEFDPECDRSLSDLIEYHVKYIRSVLNSKL